MKRQSLTILVCGSVFLVAGGCFLTPVGSTLAQVDTDLDPVAMAVADLHDEFGEGRVLFLQVLDEAEGDQIAVALIAKLEKQLQVPVLPEERADRSLNADLPPLTPVDPETGDAGISITVGKIRFDEQGYLVVEMGYARSALDGGVLEYVLDDTPEGWVIVAIRLVGVS